MALQAVPVKVERGVVRAMDGSPLPEQAYALLVILPTPAEGDNLAEWQRPFEAFFDQVRENLASKSLTELSDAELNSLVHTARQRN